jgi:hypothetical protein
MTSEITGGNCINKEGELFSIPLAIYKDINRYDIIG